MTESPLPVEAAHLAAPYTPDVVIDLANDREHLDDQRTLPFLTFLHLCYISYILLTFLDTLPLTWILETKVGPNGHLEGNEKPKFVVASSTIFLYFLARFALTSNSNLSLDTQVNQNLQLATEK